MVENSSPILKLHVELLWTIFLMNTEKDEGETDIAWLTRTQLEFEDRPLTVIRRSSQVCRKWRDIILGSSSLWGKLVDIPLLSELERRHWMNEVVRRSGQSFLHITTDNIGVSNRLAALVTLLDDHWERVQVLSVTIKVRVAGDTIVSEVFQILRRPTKSLRSFRAEFISDFGGKPDLGPGPPLFGNAAPALTSLYCGHGYLSLDPPSPWLSQLRTLHISMDSRRYTIPQFLEALKGTPALEILMLTGRVFQRAINLPSISVALPNLKSMRLISDLIVTITTILDALIIPAGCGVFVFTKHFAQPGEDLDLTHAYQTLHRYCQNYFNANCATSFRLSIASDNIEFHNSSTKNIPASPFNISVSSDVSFSGDELSLILGSFADAKLDSISYITLGIRLPDIHPFNSNFISFLSRLSLVEIVEVEEPITTLQFLLENMKDDFPIVFPKLYSLFFSTLPSSSISSGPLLPFLKWRRDAGVPIEDIDLTDLDSESSPQDMDLLEEMTGLRVVWFSTHQKDPESYREYLCGSGDPEMLRDIGADNDDASSIELDVPEISA